MSCTRHVLGVRLEHHAWHRRVTHAENRTFRGTDMWSRTIPVDEVLCHVEYVCRNCGTVRDGGECGCDRAHGDECPARLDWLARTGDQAPGAHA